MTKVIAEYNDVAILEDDKGKFLFSRENEIVEIRDTPRLPILNVHANMPEGVLGNLHREVKAMLS